MRRTTIAAILAAVFLLALRVGPVAADPVNNPNAEFITLTCGGESVALVAGGGEAAQLVDGTGVVIPATFRVVGTFVDPDTGEAVPVDDAFSIGRGQRTGQQDVLETCTFPIVEDGFTGTGTVTLFRTPRGR